MSLHSLSRSGDKQLEISRADLASLQETMLHPEHNTSLSHDQNYLDTESLKIIAKAYGKAPKDDILVLVDAYQRAVAESPDPETMIEKMDLARVFLQNLIEKSDDKGFGKHVMKKLHFDVQKKLQVLMPVHEKPANLDAAFKAALELDRVELFNKVVFSAVKNGKLTSDEFRDFLQECIDQKANATNHTQAVAASRTIEHECNRILIILNLRSVLPPVLDIEVEALDEVDPVIQRDVELSREAPLLDGILATVAIKSDEEELRAPQEKLGPSLKDPLKFNIKKSV